MNFFRISLFIQFLLASSSGSNTKFYRKLSSLLDVVKYIRDPNRKHCLFTKGDGLIWFLSDYYENFPVTCLETTFRYDYPPFEALLLDIISDKLKVDLYSTERCFHFLKDHYYKDHFVFIIRENYTKIRKIIQKIFITPCNSLADRTKNSSLIKWYIKLVKRYSTLPFLEKNYIPKYAQKKREQLLYDIKNWEFANRFLDVVYSNGTIDYIQFFSIFYHLMRNEANPLTVYQKSNSHYYFFFAIFLNQSIVKKDFKLYTLDLPELPYLVALILMNVNASGESIFPEFKGKKYHAYIQKFLGPNTKHKSLAEVLNKKTNIITLVYEKLRLEEQRPLSSLIKSFEERFPEPRNNEDSNILWQLKGIALLEESFTILQNSAIQQKKPNKASLY
jgi:hypothetical protein